MISMTRFAALVGCISILASPVMADETGLAGIHSMSKEGKRVCFSDHFHYGSGSTMPTKKAAVDDAVRAWAGFTAAEYGTDWAHFDRAGSKKISCTQGSGGFYCQIEARPCK